MANRFHPRQRCDWQQGTFSGSKPQAVGAGGKDKSHDVGVGIAARLVSGRHLGAVRRGGAVVIIPGLVLITRMQQHTAHGTSLAALLLPVGLLGVLQYAKRQQVNWGYAAV